VGSILSPRVCFFVPSLLSRCLSVCRECMRVCVCVCVSAGHGGWERKSVPLLLPGVTESLSSLLSVSGPIPLQGSCFSSAWHSLQSTARACTRSPRCPTW
jgi:hypothetical protein